MLCGKKRARFSLCTFILTIELVSTYQESNEQRMNVDSRGRGGFRGGRGGYRGGYGSGNGIVNRDRFQPGRVLRNWNVIAPANRDGQNLRELETLLNQLPGPVRLRLQEQFRDRLMDLNEIYLQLGRWPEAVFADPSTGRLYREPLAQVSRGRKNIHSQRPLILLEQVNCEASDIALFADMFSKTHTGSLLATRRIGIDGTLHRLSVILSHRTNAEGMPPVIGVTARVGRTVEGMLDALAPDLINTDDSILLIGRPNTGKTTALREFARRLSEDKKVAVSRLIYFLSDLALTMMMSRTLWWWLTRRVRSVGTGLCRTQLSATRDGFPWSPTRRKARQPPPPPNASRRPREVGVLPLAADAFAVRGGGDVGHLDGVWVVGVSGRCVGAWMHAVDSSSESLRAQAQTGAIAPRRRAGIGFACVRERRRRQRTG